MALPVLKKKDPRPISVSFRVSVRAAESLKTLAKAHNMSQADVIEYLILQEAKQSETRPRRTSK